MKSILWVASAVVAVGVAPSAARAQFPMRGPAGTPTVAGILNPSVGYTPGSPFGPGVPGLYGPADPSSRAFGGGPLPGLPGGLMPYREQPYVQVGWGPDYDDSFRYGFSRSAAPNPLQRILPPGVASPYAPTDGFQPLGAIPPPSAPNYIRNLPQIPITPPIINFKPDLAPARPLAPSEPAPPPLSGELVGWAAGLLALIFVVALVWGYVNGRRA